MKSLGFRARDELIANGPADLEFGTSQVGVRWVIPAPPAAEPQIDIEMAIGVSEGPIAPHRGGGLRRPGKFAWSRTGFLIAGDFRLFGIPVSDAPNTPPPPPNCTQPPHRRDASNLNTQPRLSGEPGALLHRMYGARDPNPPPDPIRRGLDLRHLSGRPETEF